MSYKLVCLALAVGLSIALAPAESAEQAPSPVNASGTAAETGTADAAAAPAPGEIVGERFAVHGQATVVEQLTAPFHAPYGGAHSLSPRRGDETLDMTLYLGARLWPGAEAWVNPEIDQGFGLDDTVGLAGFPSGEAYKVGRKQPYWRLPRLFVRQTVDLGGARQPLAAAVNQLGGFQSANRWVFTLGKFAVTDIFDSNQYAHDARNDFLNWTAIDAGTFDYAADAWGYTVGAAAEWYQGTWAVRAGVFDLSNVPNSETLDPGLRELQWVAELERRYTPMGMPGKVLMTLFDSRARMALLDAALSGAQAGENINAALVDARGYRSRAGVSLSLEQQLSSDLGVFARAGKAGGNVETYEFTDADRTVAAGVSLQGRRWGRADDTVGLAAIVNGISAERERFLNAGGLGVLVGDGRLPHPGAEQILETYYRWALLPWARLTFDYQEAINPGYNRDRGPVPIFAARLHAQF
ncbi:MAG TPA: carbohydrate porin [Steroidobacteraceae bacterium]|jgi:high affinity Mn2+ porin|nr:carbohydrate porin [Steroidobacteraceae bacterium]